tara:strand:- start:1210 stop:1632 length:423 start_codon:yes stop_codon:yes gene_type:complete
MTDQESPDQDRRKGAQSVVEQKLAERQEMLALFSKLAGLEPYGSGKSSVEQLKQFCQILVDYIATAHFGIYERIAEGKERRQQVVDVAASIYPRVREMTDEAVRFNDRYEDVSGPRACMTICPLWARRSQHASNSRMSCW